MATAPIAVKFHLEKIIECLDEKYSVVVLTNMSSDHHEFLKTLPNGVRFFNTRMERKIDLLSDLRSIFLLFNFFRREDISMLFTVTPKAGLLGSIAALLTGIKVRVHTFTGQVWQTKKGIVKFLLMFLDKAIYLCSSKVLVDSQSQRDYLIANSIVKEKGSKVLGHGSLCGVDLERFSPNIEAKKTVRAKLNVPINDVVFLFVGRLHPDKGIIELLKAYLKLTENIENTSLWLLGPVEIESKILKEYMDVYRLKSMHILPYVSTPELYMAAADVFCLPSHREGFGTVIIESAACGVPSIGTKIHGLTDSIADGETGLLIDSGDILALKDAMQELALNKPLRLNMGNAARKRTFEFFDQEIVVPRLIEFLDTQLAKYENKIR